MSAGASGPSEASPPSEGSGPSEASVASASRAGPAIGRRVAALALMGGLVAVSIGLVVSFGHDPARCSRGFEPNGARCCLPGQRVEHGRCAGPASACPEPLALAGGACVAPPGRVSFSGGALDDGSIDWEAAGRVRRGRVVVEPFALDAHEVTRARWAECVAAGACAPLPAAGEPSEPGEPVVGMNARDFERFCAFAQGRIPNASELAFAASGGAGRRYPWGATGAVCRRAAWGLSDGPCARGAVRPDLAGAHPDGASPEGVHDLAGNVAEWARADDGSSGYVSFGGSYRSSAASELRSWSVTPVDGDVRQAHRGGRCAYAPEP